MRLLALDADTKHIGYAHFLGDKLMRYGTYDIKAKWDDLLVEVAYFLIDEVGWGSGVEAVACEMPVYCKNAKTTIQLAQLVGLIRFVTLDHWHQFVEVAPTERLTACGIPILTRSKAAKEAVMRTVAAIYGIEPGTTHAADAIAVGMAALNKLKLRDLSTQGTHPEDVSTKTQKVDTLPCGHPASAIASSADGSHWCRECERGHEKESQS